MKYLYTWLLYSLSIHLPLLLVGIHAATTATAQASYSFANTVALSPPTRIYTTVISTVMVVPLDVPTVVTTSLTYPFSTSHLTTLTTINIDTVSISFEYTSTVTPKVPSSSFISSSRSTPFLSGVESSVPTTVIRTFPTSAATSSMISASNTSAPTSTSQGPSDSASSSPNTTSTSTSSAVSASAPSSTTTSSRNVPLIISMSVVLPVVAAGLSLLYCARIKARKRHKEATPFVPRHQDPAMAQRQQIHLRLPPFTDSARIVVAERWPQFFPDYVRPVRRMEDDEEMNTNGDRKGQGAHHAEAERGLGIDEPTNNEWERDVDLGGPAPETPLNSWQIMQRGFPEPEVPRYPREWEEWRGWNHDMNWISMHNSPHQGPLSQSPGLSPPLDNIQTPVSHLQPPTRSPSTRSALSVPFVYRPTPSYHGNVNNLHVRAPSRASPSDHRTPTPTSRSRHPQRPPYIPPVPQPPQHEPVYLQPRTYRPVSPPRRPSSPSFRTESIAESVATSGLYGQEQEQDRSQDQGRSQSLRRQDSRRQHPYASDYYPPLSRVSHAPGSRYSAGSSVYSRDIYGNVLRRG